jgi:hypothetical protein
MRFPGLILLVLECGTIVSSMNDHKICDSTDHLFVPILEVSVPLLRCIHCNVFAYHDTVKQLAKNRSYHVDEEPSVVAAVPYWRRLWVGIRRRIASAG